MTKRRVPAHERPDWPKQLRAIRRLFRGDLCRDFREGELEPGCALPCTTCGRSEAIHWLRALYEALDAAEKRLKK